ncbi:AbrB/MazE/SpoVT family DNA-binding domain-containing protein [Nitrosomonas communis]|uniref:AbrB/MazE/SpoVT family DNA-binding domain-containing protein n=1 Tax=Nitrosomonas communis TaxID=44574 RepID=UPI0026EA3EE8|nr:AbrB/MazE/SpoVT family DNA-binding domain-containing protein [Nitrosomonas communis]MCO6428789.1 AbrB/MazE/SpoVT family DNA-binding domain-containing protein [Nitrosomonas communis]
MTTATITLSREGQIVIPKEVRDKLHWGTGQQLIIEMTESGILLKSKPAVKKLRLEDLRGFLKYDGPPISTEELCQQTGSTVDWNQLEQRSR